MDEKWNELWRFEDIAAVQSAVTQKLLNCGIKVPRRDSGSARASQRAGRSGASAAAFFGVPLESGQQPSVSYRHSDHVDFKLPRFLVEAVQFLEQHTSRQGLFRKAGSVARQKALKTSLDSGNGSISEDSNVHDVAGLLKQYFRELPEPLITSRLFPVFDASFSLPQPLDRQRCVLMSCLLLPRVHLQCLCVLMKLLHSVSEVSSESLMDASNLAIVLAPNIMRPHIDIKKVAPGNPIKNLTGIAQLLIESAPLIGCVPSSVYALKAPPTAAVETITVAEHKQVKVQNVVINPKAHNSVAEERKVPNSVGEERKVPNSVGEERKVPNSVGEERKVHNSVGEERKVQNSVGEERKAHNSVVVEQKRQASEVKAVADKTDFEKLIAVNGLELASAAVFEVRARRPVLGSEVKVHNPVEKEGKMQNSLSSESQNHILRTNHVENLNSVKKAAEIQREEECVSDRETHTQSSLQTRAKEENLQEGILKGPLLYASLIGLVVLVVALLISKIVYV